jgi:carboxyl-terminal processing protease
MLGRLCAAAIGLFLLLPAVIATAVAEPRVALVIGNSNYGPEIGKLPNPVNDAGLVAQALEQTGFQVIRVTNASQKQMKRAIADFGDKLADAGPTATGLFFYAGHGLQVQGMNYLVPVDADISKEADVDIESVSADDVLKQMEFAGSRVNIVVLDACRNNPLARSMRSVTRGLAPINAVQGTFVAYSTAPGSVAADGAGANSPYSKALAKTIVQPGMGIEEAFREVRTQVMAETGNKQVPWDSSSLTAPFYFRSAAQSVAPAAAAPAAAGPSAAETAFWNSIQNSKQAGDYQAYLDQYPTGTFAPLAKSRLATLNLGTPRQQPAAQPVVQPAPQPKPAPQPVPAAVPVTPAPQPEPEAAPATSPAPTSKPAFPVDSNGVDCRIIDTNRSVNDCVGVKKSKPANKPRG